jgi:hypothetical protein
MKTAAGSTLNSLVSQALIGWPSLGQKVVVGADWLDIGSSMGASSALIGFDGADWSASKAPGSFDSADWSALQAQGSFDGADWLAARIAMAAYLMPSSEGKRILLLLYIIIINVITVIILRVK